MVTLHPASSPRAVTHPTHAWIHHGTANSNTQPARRKRPLVLPIRRQLNVSDQSGDGLEVKLSSRGTGFDDLDNDGDVDVVILNWQQRPTILRNDSPAGNHWLQVRLRGTKTNRDGVGARVKVTAGDLVQVDEVHSGRGYQSHYGTRLHFGLGKRDRVDRIEVRWVGGGVDVLQAVAVNRVVTITEGGSQIEKQ